MRGVIDKEIDIKRKPEVVFDYCSDYSHEPEWNIRMKHVQKLSPGPVGVGTRYEMELVPGRTITSECVSFDRPRAWRMEGSALGMNMAMAGRVTPTSEGAHLVLETEFAAGSLRGVAIPFIRRRMWPELERDIHTIKAILEEGDPSDSSAS